MIPFPNGLFAGGSHGVLDILSSTTTIVGAWSSARSLKAATYSAGAMKVRSNEAGTQTTIGFTGPILNKAALLTVCVGGQNEGVIELFDQSGNANHFAPQSGAADGVVVNTSGALSSPVTVSGGASLPMLGFGPGNNAGSSGVNPNLSTAVPMPVSFGATAKHFMLTVIKATSGSGTSNFALLGSFLHTGDANAFSTTTSIYHAQRNGSLTSGSYRSYGNGAARANVTLSSDNGLHMLGALFDGTNNTLYADRAAGTPVAYTSTLGSGGSYAFGADPGTPTGDAWGGFAAEVIVGTFTNSAAAFAAGDWTTLQNNIRTFYGTP